MKVKGINFIDIDMTDTAGDSWGAHCRHIKDSGPLTIPDGAAIEVRILADNPDKLNAEQLAASILNQLSKLFGINGIANEAKTG